MHLVVYLTADRPAETRQSASSDADVESRRHSTIEEETQHDEPRGCLASLR